MTIPISKFVRSFVAPVLSEPLLCGLVAAGGVVAGSVMLGMAPEPDPIPRRWQLSMTV